MFRTRDERRESASTVSVGIRVTFPDGVQHWYPGGSAALAGILFERSVPDDLRAHPDTRVEFGQYTRGTFACLEVVKEGKRPDAANPV